MIESENSSFIFLPDRKYVLFTNKEFENSLMKWSMKGRINCACFGFDQTFKSYNINLFIQKFFSDPNVYSQINERTKLIPCDIEAIPCTLTSMELFTRLNGAIIRENGKIIGSHDEYCNGILVSDELRKMLLIEDSDNYELYSEENRREFLFQLFKGFVLGGEICQFEEDITQYLNMTKTFYKDVVSVQKDADGKVMVLSHIYKIRCKNGKDEIVFPDTSNHENSFAYVIIDPMKKHLHLFWHNFGCGHF